MTTTTADLVEVIDLLAEARAAGLRFAVSGDTISASPSSKLTPELLERFKACKPELLAMLRLIAPEYRVKVDPAPWSAEMDLAEALRHMQELKRTKGKLQ